MLKNSAMRERMFRIVRAIPPVEPCPGLSLSAGTCHERASACQKLPADPTVDSRLGGTAQRRQRARAGAEHWRPAGLGARAVRAVTRAVAAGDDPRRDGDAVPC